MKKRTYLLMPLIPQPTKIKLLLNLPPSMASGPPQMIRSPIEFWEWLKSNLTTSLQREFMSTHHLAVDWMITGRIDFHHDQSSVALWRNQSRLSILSQPSFFSLIAKMKILISDYGRNALISQNVLEAHHRN